MQTTHPGRKLHPGVILLNGAFLLGGILLSVAMFANWLDGPRFAGGGLLLLGLGFVAEDILKRVGWLAETERPKSRGWGRLLILFGVASMSLGGILMLLGY